MTNGVEVDLGIRLNTSEENTEEGDRNHMKAIMMTAESQRPNALDAVAKDDTRKNQKLNDESQLSNRKTEMQNREHIVEQDQDLNQDLAQEDVHVPSGKL